MIDEVMSVIKTLVLKEREVQTVDGGWYFMRILPYRSIHDVINGAIITFTDITGQKKREKDLDEIRMYLENVPATVSEPFMILDKDLRILSSNDRFFAMFKVTRKRQSIG